MLSMETSDAVGTGFFNKLYKRLKNLKKRSSAAFGHPHKNTKSLLTEAGTKKVIAPPPHTAIRPPKSLVPTTRKLALAWFIAVLGAVFFTNGMGVGMQLFAVGTLSALGGIALLRMSAQDERQQLEYLMRIHETNEDKELLRALNNLPHGIAYWDRDGNLLWHNHAYRDMMGLSTGTKLRGRKFTNIMSMAANPNRFETVCDMEDHRIATAACLDGRHIRIEDIAQAKRNFVTIITDISEEVRAKHDNNSLEKERQKLIRQCTADKLAAEAASRSKTSFLAHLSHDMRTPLNHIIGFADLVQHEPFGPLGDKRYIGYLGDIKRSGEALLDSFAAILQLSELESGQTAQNEEPLAVDDLLKSQTAKYKARADRIGVEFVDFASANGSVFADKNLMGRMLGNILDNAVKFTPKGGKIAVNSWDGADGIIIEVTDTGIGIPHERMALLNQPFVLGEAAFAKEQNSLGLGISTARAIAELSGGRIHIDSAVGIGTTVLISLPKYEVVAETALDHVA